MKNHSRTIGVAAIIGLLSAAGTALGQAHDHDHSQPGHTHEVPAAAQVPVTPATGPQPKIVIEKMEHEFGRISDEQPVTVEFAFKNMGDAPLVFKDQPRASCGCTAGRLDKLTFLPGEGGTLSVKFDPKGKHGDQNQRVVANTNDPAMPEVVCKFHCFVRPTVTVEPPLVGFGEVLAGQTARQVVKVRGPKDFAVTYASNTKGRYITTRVIETHETTADGEPGGESLVEFTLNGKAPRGTLQALTTARTTSDKHPLVDIQVTAEIVGDLQILPPRLNVGVLEGGQTFSKTFRVASRTGTPFRVKGVEQKSATMPAPLDLLVTPVEGGNDAAYLVEVRGMAPNPGTPVMATLVVTTDQGGEETMEVQVNGVVRMPTPPAGSQPPQPIVEIDRAEPGVFQPPAQPAPPTRDEK